MPAQCPGVQDHTTSAMYICTRLPLSMQVLAVLVVLAAISHTGYAESELAPELPLINDWRPKRGSRGYEGTPQDPRPKTQEECQECKGL